MIDIVAGDSAASPMPTFIRHRNSVQNDRAEAQMAVAAVHSSTPTKIRRLRLVRSARNAIGSAVAA